ncbi:hypothetical protein [Streptosporangium canum]|uniref:hypothetical protein n=1 Tax=Streptosporangium canum TaxID=324952 RepID=UPI003415C1F1
MVQREHTRLEWRSPHQVLERARPVAWTCFCRATVYELLEGAGRAFLRRTVQRDGDHQVHETAPCSINEAWAIWTALLTGRTR